MLYGTIWALLPPVIAIALALITKEVYSSLFIGILSGALLYTGFAPIATLNTLVVDGFIATIADTWNIGIFMFLILLGIMVSLINKAGGSRAFGRWAIDHVKTRTGAQLSTFLLGVLIFIDDYFNCLTVGTVMRPVADSHHISRAKLAYLIDATAAPICMIAPVSSWAAAVSGMVDEGVYSGIELFVRAIPYNFYSLFTLAFLVTITLMNFDYGPMRLHEYNAQKKNDLFTCGMIRNDAEELDASENGKVIDLILPVIMLIVLCICGLMYIGGFWDGASFVESFGNTDASLGLPWGSIIALVFTVIYLLCRRVITFKDAMACIPKGFVAMVPAMLILSFAVTLKTMTGFLGASDYVASVMAGAAGGLASFLPAIIFIVACFLAFSTGTSWGTFGILLPIVIDVLPVDDKLFFVGISACLAGAVMGDHCSPISDTTIMSSAGSQCDHINHVSTQIPYACTVAGIAFFMYLFVGVVRMATGAVPGAVICLPLGILLVIATLFVLRKIYGNKLPKGAEA